MYGKIFDSIFDSTLVADGGFLPTYIFMSMIAIADKDGFVEIAPKALFRRLGFDDNGLVTYDNFIDAINYLQQPDPDSNSSLHEGKRILPLCEMDDYEGNRGWLIVNSKAYREKGSKDDKRRADRERIAAKRRKVAMCRKVSQKVANVAYADTDTDTLKNITQTSFDVWWEIYPKKVEKARALEVWDQFNFTQERAVEITGLLKKQLAQCERFDRPKQKIKSPNKYLEGKCWDDEIVSKNESGFDLQPNKIEFPTLETVKEQIKQKLKDKDYDIQNSHIKGIWRSCCAAKLSSHEELKDYIETTYENHREAVL